MPDRSLGISFKGGHKMDVIILQPSLLSVILVSIKMILILVK